MSQMCSSVLHFLIYKKKKEKERKQTTQVNIQMLMAHLEST